MIAFEGTFQQIAALLIIAAVLGALLRLAHQPLIIAFIAVGVLVGPAFLGLVPVNEEIELLAHLGVALLLFIVGLKLDLRLITSHGPVALVTGIGQMVATAIVGYLLATLLGFGLVDAVYIAVALTFSSTIIVVKLLSDRREIDQLHGRIALGVLIVQDIAVVLLMIALSAFDTPSASGELFEGLLAVALSGAVFIAAIALVARFVLPRLFDAFARTPELLVLSAVAWALGLAAIGDALGFSEEVGAFLAGLALASSQYREAIGTRLTTLRDFLLLFFFVQLGLGMDLSTAGSQLWPALALAAFVLVGKPVAVMALMGALRYRRRVSFSSAVSLAQISEFSLIFAALGVELGHIDSRLLAMLTLVAVITIALSSYLVVASRRLFEMLSPLLAIFERRTPKPDEDADDGPCPSVIVFGLGRYGGHIVEELHAAGVPVMGIDFDPVALSRIERLGIPTRYGDAEDPDLPATLPLECAEWIVSSAPSLDTNRSLLDSLRHHGVTARLVVTAHTAASAKALESSGADLLLRPFVDAADDAVRALGYDVAPDHTDDAGSDPPLRPV